MIVRMDLLFKAISGAIDYVEIDLLGASTHHGSRLAVLCSKMGKLLNLSPEETNTLAICAMLHDNALTEYLFAARTGKHHDPKMKKHCEFGQRNVELLNFKTNIKDFILYHHERADGKGPFGIREGEGPLEAELIAIADSIDVKFHLQEIDKEKLILVRDVISRDTGKRYTKKSAEILLEVLDWPLVQSLKDDVIHETAAEELFPWEAEMGEQAIFGFAEFIARIIDYKSVFTRRHSTQIANKAWYMGEYYKYDPSQKAAIYLAAALHDLGKLGTPIDILEKPGKLTHDEYLIIMDHVRLTYDLLKDVDGLAPINIWAWSHHEKLTGKGYPFGKKAEEIDFNSRLLACIDIYQAVSEDRPYHPGRSHYDTMHLLYGMAENGEVDMDIVRDLDKALAPHDGKEVPPPE